MAFGYAGINLEFSGKESNEIGVCSKTGKIVVRIDPRYYRPTEVNLLVGDSSKAHDLLDWKSSTSISDLCKEMVFSDIFRATQSTNNNSKKIEEIVHESEGFFGWYEKNTKNFENFLKLNSFISESV